ncbi:pyridoxal-phosphate dependent protein [[Clostridium] methylpentosum DSM 5476]|uniref:Pyridoxal-phosphate dependent protein n=1 Tax=[Clostridium] methylpentosum DSM 5476 TaxID=537013 RepID=C0EG49_9FIRM|nr:pyridoxal-phosphate dependent protein [[Clostridium] methylpentosum DSM 5476]MDY3988216.1 PLP-dependent cysteine synthase family protein [Massilioclostridium sp.]
MDRLKRFQNIAGLIGNTPLLEIHFRYKGEHRRLFAKAEHYNLTGSIKDRVAYHILKKAYWQGTISENDVIVEATSGNTGISFSAIGSYLGHQVIIYMPDWMSAERINLMKSYGAEVRLVSHEEGGFLGSISMTEELAKQGGVFLPRQFSNDDNVEAHFLMTGEEILSQLSRLGLTPDGVVAGVGTGGTVMGIGKRLQKTNPACKIFPLEPLNSPTLSTGYKVGRHRIQGISDEFVPSILKLDELDGVVSVDDGDSIIMARMLSEQLGIGVGVSSGANFLGSIMAQDRIGEDSVIVTVFADDNKKYLSTDYSDPQEMKEHYITHDLELLDMIAHR